MKQSTHSLKKVLLTASFIGSALVVTAQATTPKTDMAVSWTDTFKINNNGQLQASYKEVKLKKNFFVKPQLNLTGEDELKTTKTYQSNLDEHLYIILSGRDDQDRKTKQMYFQVLNKAIIYKDELKKTEYAIRIHDFISNPQIYYTIDSAGTSKRYKVEMFTDVLFYFLGRNISANPQLVIELVRNKIALQERITSLTQDKPWQEKVDITAKLKPAFLLNYIDTITVANNEGKRIKAYKDVPDYHSYRTYQSEVDKNLYLTIITQPASENGYADYDASRLTFIYGGKNENDYPSIEVKHDRDDNFVISYDMGVHDPAKATGQIVQMDPILYGNLLRDLTQRATLLTEIVKEKIAFKASL